MSDIRNLIDQAISLAGSQAKLGEAAGVSQNAIFNARKQGSVSAELAVALERATGGQVPRWRLRPDLWAAPEGAAA